MFACRSAPGACPGPARRAVCMRLRRAAAVQRAAPVAHLRMDQAGYGGQHDRDEC